jgi:hypothetical protein
VTVAIWILSLVVIAEFVASPINLWTGRNMHFLTEFTGFSPAATRSVFATVMLAGAALTAVGLAVRPLSIVGAAIITCACALYLVRLAAPGRRAASGIVAYLFFGGVAAALLILQATR